MTGLQYSPLHVTELCGEMQGKFIVGRARLIKHVHDLILIHCVFICLHVNMGLTISVLKVRFYFYCLVARNMPSNVIASLVETFCALPGSTLDKLKRLNSELFTKVY